MVFSSVFNSSVVVGRKPVAMSCTFAQISGCVFTPLYCLSARWLLMAFWSARNVSCSILSASDMTVMVPS